MKHRTSPKKRTPVRKRLGPRRLSGYLIITGLILLLLATCDFAARLDIAAESGARGAIYRLSDFGSSMSASIVILAAAGLGLDYLERKQDR